MTRLLPAVLVFAVATATAQDDPAKTAKALEGKYTLTNMIVGGKSTTKPEAEREKYVIRNGTLVGVATDGKKEEPLNFKLTGGANVDFTDPGKPGGPHMLGVYKLDGKTLTFTVAESNKPDDRPKDVTATGDKVFTLVLEKVSDAKPKDEKKDK